MTRACPVIGCGAPIASYLLVCSADWRRVPYSLRTRYEQAFQRVARAGNAATPDARATLDELRAAVIEAASAERLHA